MPIAAHARQVVSGGGPILLGCGIAVLVVGAVVILAAPSLQKRVGLAPDQTERPGPAQIWITRIIGAAFCVFGLGMIIGGTLILS